MARKDIYEALPEAASDWERGNSHTPKFMGMLVSRIMITERQPIESTANGATIGQLIDQRIEEMQTQWREDSHRKMSGEPMPAIHSITFEFPQD